MNRTERKQYIRQTELINRRFELKFKPAIQKAIKSQISSLIKHLKENGNVNGWNEISNPELSAAVERLYKQVGVFYANKETRQLKKAEGRKDIEIVMEQKGFGFNAIWVNEILNYFRLHLVEHITFGAVQTMREYFLPIISKAISEGTPFEEIAREIEEKGFEKWQAARIVRTEVNSAANVGTMAAGKTYEYETNKEWISASDMRVRGHDPKDHANHVRLDGKVVDYNEPFIDPVSGVKLMQPGDPKAIGTRRDKAATIINCRCTHVLIAKRDANDRLIPKTGVKAEMGWPEEKEIDLSEVKELVNGFRDELSEEVRDIGREVRNIKDETMTKEIKIVSTSKEELADLFQQELNVYHVKADDIVRQLKAFINGIDVNPEVNVETKEVAEEIQRLHDVLAYKIGLLKDMMYNAAPDVEKLGNELKSLINVRFEELMKEVQKKRKYKFEVVKDSNDLIISATAQQI